MLEDPNNPALFHDSSNEIGQLDVQPHGSTHVEVGGVMARFETAALDPVFWIHHCNVDRLWETYARDLEHGYPFENGSGAGTAAQQSWIGQQFRFRRPDGTTKVWKAPDVLDLAVLGYAYDTTAPPPLPPPPATGRPAPRWTRSASTSARPSRWPRRARWRRSPTWSSPSPAGRVPTRTSASTPSRRARSGCCGSTASAPRAPPRRPTTCSSAWPRAAPPTPPTPSTTSGSCRCSGCYEASRDDGTSAADGQRRQLDVTAQVAAQAATFRPLAARVRLRATNPGRDLAGVGLTIERVTLEFA